MNNDIDNDFDYGKTGPSTGSNAIWVTINRVDVDGKKSVEMQIGRNGELGTCTNFSGRLEDFRIQRVDEWRGDVPPHEEYILVLSAMHEGQVKRFNISFSSHWNSPATGNMLNSLRGQIENTAWNRGINISVWLTLKQGSTRHLLNASLKDLDGNRFQLKYPWDETQKAFIGVPKPVSAGDHVPVDFSPQKEFFAKVAQEIAAFFGSPTGEVKNGAPQNIPTQEKKPSSTAAPSTTDRALTFFRTEAQKANGDHDAIVKAGLECLAVALKKPDIDMGYLARNLAGQAIIYGARAGEFVFEAGAWTYKVKDMFAPPVPTEDDLPF